MTSLEKDVEVFVSQNRRHLHDEAISVLKGMPADDRRRVLAAGPLELFGPRDLGTLFRRRAQVAQQREQELAERKGKDLSEYARYCTGEEARQWIDANREHMDEFSIAEFNAMSGEDKSRVISDGPLRANVDVIYMIRTRASHSKELTTQVEALFAQKKLSSQGKGKEPEAKPMAPRVAALMQDVFNSYVGPEVPANQRRCDGGLNQEPPPEPPREALVGKVKGVDGVIEILKAKYGCQKGQRWKVVGETAGPAGIWKLKGPEGERSVPKTHLKEGGWKWVLEEEQALPGKPPGKPPAKPQPPPQKAEETPPDDKPPEDKSPEAKKRTRSPSRSRVGDSDAETSAEAKKKKKKSKKKGKRRSRSQSGSGRSQGDASPEVKKRRRSPSSSDAERGGGRAKHKRKAKHKREREGREKSQSGGGSSDDGSRRRRGRRK
mmetsp:Transcript_70297/g.184253  ORF Transcript_70297/g.184253 Transcript_70297/m.184253 type:complete len:435 (-) Transcript_70297:26-1330(-)